MSRASNTSTRNNRRETTGARQKQSQNSHGQLRRPPPREAHHPRCLLILCLSVSLSHPLPLSRISSVSHSLSHLLPLSRISSVSHSLSHSLPLILTSVSVLGSQCTFGNRILTHTLLRALHGNHRLYLSNALGPQIQAYELPAACFADNCSAYSETVLGPASLQRR